MIHNHDFRRLRSAAGVEHVAATELRAFLTEAILTGGRDHRPRGRLFRQIGQFGKIAGLRGRRPARYLRQQPRSAALAAQKRALLEGQLQSMSAQIVRASFEQCHLYRQAQCFGQQRHITAKQLILKGARPGGNDHAASRKQGRYEVGKGFTGTGARLDDKRFAECQRTADRRRHGRLLRAMGIAGNCTREGTRRAEHVFIVGIDVRSLR